MGTDETAVASNVPVDAVTTRNAATLESSDEGFARPRRTLFMKLQLMGKWHQSLHWAGPLANRWHAVLV